MSSPLWALETPMLALCLSGEDTTWPGLQAGKARCFGEPASALQCAARRAGARQGSAGTAAREGRFSDFPCFAPPPHLPPLAHGNLSTSTQRNASPRKRGSAISLGFGTVSARLVSGRFVVVSKHGKRKSSRSRASLAVPVLYLYLYQYQYQYQY